MVNSKMLQMMLTKAGRNISAYIGPIRVASSFFEWVEWVLKYFPRMSSRSLDNLTVEYQSGL